MSEVLSELTIEQLFALVGALADPDQGIPAGIEDPAVRREFRARGVGSYSSSVDECRSRRVVVSAMGLGAASHDDPVPRLPAEAEDFILLSMD